MDGGEKKEVRRPMNAFLIFCKRHRGFVREKNPDMDNRSVTRVLGDLWANLGEEKKTYTNLAKQYKDAFMKANPNYKWHSTDKSQNSTAKVVSKPTNCRVIKSVAEINTDGTITPGKLADPEKMGGLNLLLMADKETCAPLTASVPLSSARTMAVFQPSLTRPASDSAADQSTVSASALLQLAEMCTSELHGCSENRQQSSPQTLPTALPLSGFSCVSQQPMPPPKKRVRHWSLTEPDGESGTSSDSWRKYITGSLSPQNTLTQKMRCTSLGSALSPADRYSSVNTCRPYPPRRKLSSSATESIPSPTGPLEDGMDEADSPVFSPDATRQENLSGETRSDSHDSFNYLPHNLSRFVNRSPTSVSKTPVHISSFDQKGHSVGKRVPQPTTPNPVTVSLHQPLSVLTGASRSALPAVPDHPLPDTSQPGLLLSLCSVLTPKCYSNREVDAQSDKGNSFSTWREVDKRRTKSEELLPEALNLHVSSGYTDETCPPSTRQRHPHEKQVRYSSLQQGFPAFESKCDIQTSSPPSSVPVDLSFVTGICSAVKTSALSTGRIASILNNSNVPSDMFCLDTSSYHSASETLTKMNNEAKKCVKINAEKKEASEQSCSLPALTSTGTNSTINHLQPGFKILDTQGANLSINSPRTFREVKLKKKWTERMLTETKLQDLTQQTENNGGNLSSKETFAAESHADKAADSFIMPGESQPDRVLLQNFNSVTTNSSSTNEATVLRMPSAYDIPSLQALLILNQSAGLPEAEPNHASFTNTSHIKLMLQLAQNQHTDKQTAAKTKNLFDESAFKPSVMDFSGPQLDYKYVNVNQQQLLSHTKSDNDSSGRQQERTFRTKEVNNADKDSQVKSEELNKKQVLNQIAACGKKFMDRIVEQLCKSDFSGSLKEEDVSAGDECWGHSPRLSDVKPETDEVQSSRESLRGGPAVEWLKKEEQRGVRMLEGSCLDSKVRDSVRRSVAELDQTVEDGSSPSTSVSINMASKHQVTGSGAEDSFTKKETVGHGAETLVQNQWSAVAPEFEQSDVNEDSSMQPVRKSRRANRGQKYQELIKEGFIQPSRERLAARNAERGGRSFGTREEFEKIELKRTLKRSASEKDVPSDGPVIFSGNTVAESSVDKRFTSGDFDLEKEIESLPVCSLEQLDRKKAVKRRCEADSLGLPLPHRNNGDHVSTLLRAPTCTSHSKHGPFSGSISKMDDFDGPCCLAPHIPLPKEERPTEPVIGCRKRKARRHCIMRISVLDEKTPMAEMANQKIAEPLSSACPKKQPCSLPRETVCDNLNVSGSVNTCHASGSSVNTCRASGSSVNSCHASGSSVNSGCASGSTGPVLPMPPACKAEADGDDKSRPFKAQDCLPKRKDGVHVCVVSLPQAVTGTEGMAPQPGMLPVRSFNENLPSQSLSAKSSMYKTQSESQPSLATASGQKMPKLSLPLSATAQSSAYKTQSESQPSLATASGQKMPKLSLPLSASAQYGQIRTTSASLETPASCSSLETLALTASIEAASSETRSVTGPTVLKSLDSSVASGQATSISSDGNYTLSVRTVESDKPHEPLGTHTGFSPALSAQESAQTKGIDRKPRKTSIGKTKSKSSHRDEKLQAEVQKAKSPLSRKYNQENERSMYVKSSTTPLVSALLGHIDLSYAIQCAERGEGKAVSLPQFWADCKTTEPPEENGSFNASIDTASIRSAETARLDSTTPILPVNTNPWFTLKTHFIPLSSVESHVKDCPSGAYRKEMEESATLLNSAQRPKATPPSLLSTDDPDFCEKPSVAAVRNASSSPHKPHPSLLSVTHTKGIPTAIQPFSAPPEASLVPESGSSASLSQHQSLCPRTESGSPTNHSVYIARNSNLSSSSPLHYSLLSQISSSSLGTHFDNTSTLSTVPLSPLMQPASSAALPSSPTVISLATSIPSSKNDIVSYTVIGSASAMESASPHMIGSPHLPESPSVAIVQS